MQSHKTKFPVFIRIFSSYLLIVLSCLIQAKAESTSTDSVVLKKNTNAEFKPIPRQSVRWGILPGGGQIYNRDYFKVPIVCAALIVSVGTIVTNKTKYHSYLDSYFSLYDLREYVQGSILGSLVKNPNFGKQVSTKATVRLYNWLTTSYTDVEDVTIDQIKRGKDRWRRYKNLSTIASVAIYSLSIIEANVAAHMKSFDISEDLTLKIHPHISRPLLLSEPIIGVSLAFNMK